MENNKRDYFNLVTIFIHAMLSNPNYCDVHTDTVVRLAKEMADELIKLDYENN